jgi:hypothetical protein
VGRQPWRGAAVLKLRITPPPEFKYKLPDGWEVGDTLILATHAVVRKTDDPAWTETAWGVICGQLHEYPFPGANWATYIPYELQVPR